MALELAVSSANLTNRHDDVSMHSRGWQAPRFVTTGRRRCQTETIEMYGGRPTLIFAVVFVCQERARALSGFVSPGGSCVRQTVIRGSLGTLVLQPTPPIHSTRQSESSSGKSSIP